MVEHYFTAEPASADERSTLTVELAGREVTVHTAPGVFSAGRLDLGTRVLLRSVPPPPATGAPARPRLRLGADRADPRAGSPGGDRVGGGRQPACPGPAAAHRRRPRADEPAGRRAGRGPRRRDVRGHLVQPAHPGGQGRPARDARRAGSGGSSRTARRGSWCSAPSGRTRSRHGSRGQGLATDEGRPAPRASGCCGSDRTTDAGSRRPARSTVSPARPGPRPRRRPAPPDRPARPGPPRP